MTEHITDTAVAGRSLTNALMSHSAIYSVDYYQREYAWTIKEVRELLEDLHYKFKESYSEGDNPKSTIGYTQYFLGSYVLSRKDGKDYIIDGQQRLTTLTLLFLAIYHLSNDYNHILYDAKRHVLASSEDEDIEFRISIKEREETMTALLERRESKDLSNNPSNKLLVENYAYIEEYMREHFDIDLLRIFSKWLSNRVLMVSITAYKDSEAYTIFEAMNDRGKELSHLDMLKGYLLSLVEHDRLEEAMEIWRRISQCFEGNLENFSKFIVDVLRARWATSTSQTVSKRSSKSSNKAVKNDWSEIQSHYHRFLKENRFREGIEIKDSSDVIKLLKDLEYYSHLFMFLEEKKKNLSSGYEEIYYLNSLGIPYLDLFFYSLIEPYDTVKDRDLKIKIISKFLNIRAGVYSWNSLDSANDSNASTYLVRLAERFKKIDEYKDYNMLVWFLYNELNTKMNRPLRNNGWGKFEATNAPCLSPTRTKVSIKNQIFYLLANFSSFLENKNTGNNIFSEFYENKHEIEHVIAANIDVNEGYFTDQESLDKYRNYIGALGLLPKRINSSYNDMSYSEKSKKYPHNNLFLGSLSRDMYNANGTFANKPGLNSMISENRSLSGLFKSYDKFSTKPILERNELCAELASIIWNVEDIADYRDKTVFETMDSLNEYVGSELPEDEYEEGDTEIINNYSVGTTLYYINDQTYVEGVFTGGNKIRLTTVIKGSYRGDFSKSAQENFKYFHSTYTEIMKNAIRNSDGKTYNWNGSIENVPIKMLINLAHSKVVGGHVTLEKIKVLSDGNTMNGVSSLF